LSTNNSVDVSLAGQTGTVAFVGSTSPTLVTPLLGTPTSGNLSNCTAYPVASLSGLGSGVATALAATVNGSGAIALTTSAALVTPTLGAATATSITFSPTTGGIVGTTTNNNASAGYVGEYVSNAAYNVAVNTATATDITTISLTAGDWDVWGELFFGGSITYYTIFYGWISTTSATSPGSGFGVIKITTLASSLTSFEGPIAIQRFSLATTTTIYLSCNPTYVGSAGSSSLNGFIQARRVR